MSVLNSFKIKISNFLLKRKLKKFSRNRELKNLGQCNSILIIASNKEDEDANELRRLISYLKQLNKEVFTLFYIENNKNDLDIEVSEIKLFKHENLNKLFIPKDPDMLMLIDREFDLLIDLSLQETFPLKYIHALSKAKLKVGAAMNYKKDFGDITIEIEKNPTITYLITQIKHYLTQINRN